MSERSVQWIACEMDADMKGDVETQINKAIDQNDMEEKISKYMKNFFD